MTHHPTTLSLPNTVEQLDFHPTCSLEGCDTHAEYVLRNTQCGCCWLLCVHCAAIIAHEILQGFTIYGLCTTCHTELDGTSAMYRLERIK